MAKNQPVEPPTPPQTKGSVVRSGAGRVRIQSSIDKIREQPGYPEMLSNLAK